MPPPALSPDLADLVAALKEDWRGGVPPDVVGALLRHPELLSQRSLVVDLAYEEYCLREEAGAAPDPESFCKALPAFRTQVREVISGHRYLAEHPEVLDQPARPWPEPGDTVDGLRVERELGRGAFARAYLAIDPNTGGRPVVLKLSPVASVEARTLGPLDHPHVGGVYWARPADGWFSICMPYVGAATLRDAIDLAFRYGRPRTAEPWARAMAAGGADPPVRATGRPPVFGPRTGYWTAAAAVAARLAGALAHLHRAGIAHGDLKPSNILLGTGGHPYLIDFNLATGPNAVGRYGGTLPYMAPERLRWLLNPDPAGTPGDRADVYAFGAVLFETLTGAPPFPPAGLPDPSQEATDLLRRQEAAPARVRRVAPAVPRRLAEVVDACLQADPARRPAAADVQRRLDRFARRWPRRLWWSAVMVTLLAAAAAAVWLSRPVAPFDQGVTYLRRGEVAPAMREFDEAYRVEASGRAAAHLAYCLTLSGNHRAAVPLYQAAVETGYGPAWVHNDRAHSLAALGRKNLKEAAAEAEEAWRLSRENRGVRFNRVWIQFRQTCEVNQQPFDRPDLLADLAAVLADGPLDAALCYEAALVYAWAAPPDGPDRAIFWLGRAVGLGKPASQLDGDLLLRPRLASDPRFRPLTQLPQPANPAAPLNLRIVSPWD